MRLSFMSFIIGLLFGVGLTISQMINPAKVLNFLDVTGTWDPSLALVMGGASRLLKDGPKTSRVATWMLLISSPEY